MASIIIIYIAELVKCVVLLIMVYVFLKSYKELKGEKKMVFCRNCKYWDKENHSCTIRDSYGWDYKPNDFCSYGEPKEVDS